MLDTNVPIVANGKDETVPLDCQLAAVDLILSVTRDGRVALDDGNRILDEYATYLDFSGQPGTGDSFFRWIHDNRWNDDLCSLVSITPRADDPDDFVEFPSEHGELHRFDRSDRKFVAVALANPRTTTIAEATDTDFIEHQADLESAGVQLLFICPDYIREVYER